MMVDRIDGVRGASNQPGRSRQVGRNEKREVSPPDRDQVDISKSGAKAAANVARFVQFVKSAPDVRADLVSAARNEVDNGETLTEEAAVRLADIVIKEIGGLK